MVVWIHYAIDIKFYACSYWKFWEDHFLQNIAFKRILKIVCLEEQEGPSTLWVHLSELKNLNLQIHLTGRIQIKHQLLPRYQQFRSQNWVYFQSIFSFLICCSMIKKEWIIRKSIDTIDSHIPRINQTNIKVIIISNFSLSSLIKDITPLLCKAINNKFIHWTTAFDFKRTATQK